MTEFWETSFRDKQTMWGFSPADSALSTADLFREKGLTEILVPGFGYGRNAQAFVDQGLKVTGIEISETAIDLSRKNLGANIDVYHGSVGDMPYDEKMYDGIFCYALIHLLNLKDRAKLINDCYHQLRPGGYMVFVALSTGTAAYGEGKRLGKDRYLSKHGVELFFYDLDSVNQEFGNFGIQKTEEITEPKNSGGKPSQRFWLVQCTKEEHETINGN